jgi:hypothetical protein
MKRVLLAGIGVLASILLSAAPSFAGPPAPHGPAGEAGQSGRITAPAVAPLTMQAVNADGDVRTLAVPPSSGCDYARLFGSIVPSYDSTGKLSSVVAAYYSQTYCPTTGSDQNMARLEQQASLWQYPNQVQVAAKDSCTDCTLAHSSGYYGCYGQSCAGWYLVEGDSLLQLPAGWTWTGTTPSTCTLTAADTMKCTVYTNWWYVYPTK